MRPILLMLLLSAVMINAAGCESEDTLVPAPVVHTPLELDPLEEYTLAEWYTNGEHLLHLAPDQAYRLFKGINRYHPPVERGRWDHISYAVLQLQPYDEHRSDARRVRIRRTEDGRIGLVLDSDQPLMPLASAPVAPEDHLLGVWINRAGMLRLQGDLRYEFAPGRGGQPRRMAMLAGHAGRWRLTERVVRLTPDTPGLGPYFLQVRSADSDILLDSDDGPFVRLSEDPSKPLPH